MLMGVIFSSVGPINVRYNPYNVRYTFEKIGIEQGNYNIAYAYSSIKIEPKPVISDWTQSDLIWTEDFKLIYDGDSHILHPSIVGLCGGDSAQFILGNSPQDSAGNYTSVIIGIDNPNYELDIDNIDISEKLVDCS